MGICSLSLSHCGCTQGPVGSRRHGVGEMESGLSCGEERPRALVPSPGTRLCCTLTRASCEDYALQSSPGAPGSERKALLPTASPRDGSEGCPLFLRASFRFCKGQLPLFCRLSSEQVELIHVCPRMRPPDSLAFWVSGQSV